MFVSFFIRRPVFASVCSLLIIVAGAIAIPTLPISQFPNLAPPQVSVGSGYIGANAQVVESSVTQPIEQAINGAEGMQYITSTSGNDGSSSITATFDLGRDLDIAAVDVQNRVSTAMGRLPQEVQNTGISINKNSGSFVLAIAFYSEKGEYDSLFISNYIDLYLRDALKRVNGVGEVIIFGERKYAMRIWVDPLRLAQRNLSATDMIAALRDQNVQVAAGQIGQSPVPPGTQVQMSVRASGRLSDPKQFERVVVSRGRDGSLVQVRDVGRVELGAEQYSSNLFFNGYDAIGVGVLQLSSANALEVAQGIRGELDRLAQQFPPGLQYKVAFDPTVAVEAGLTEVIKTLSEAMIIVVLVIFVFLQSWRSTLIPAITIPVSLIGTFAFAYFFGFSINTLTLFGITLAIGLVVDDAIVVIENVERHIDEGISDPRRASEVAMSEVTGAVVATSIVLIAVFIPVALFPGTTGKLYQQFAMTIAFSIALSAFNALTLTPALAALLLKHSANKNLLFRWFNSGLNKITHGYSRSIHYLEVHKLIIAGIFVAALVGTYFMYRAVPTSFVPDEDLGYLIVSVQTPEGSSLDVTSQATQRATEILKKDQDITDVFAVPGFGFDGSAPNRGLMFLNLRSLDERKGSDHNAAAILNRIRGPLMSIPGAFVIPFQPPPIQGLGSYGGFEFVLQQRGGGTLEELEAALNGFIAGASKRPELTGVFSSYNARTPQVFVQVDRELARSYNVPFSEIASTLQVYMGSVYVNDFDMNNRAYRVYVQADAPFRAQPRNLREFYVRSQSGQMFPLDTFVRTSETTTSSVISHYNLFRSASINGSAAPGYSSGQAIQAMEEVARETLPLGYAYEWTGLALEEIRSGSAALILFGLGLLVVYLVLSAQYESYVLPFIILLSVPMAILGGLGAQALRGLSNDVYCQIGLVLLIGLASKNGILIVEFAEQLQQRGMGLLESAAEAARLRLRPILMTSFAFILGVLPLVFASGAGEESRHSVGTTVFGGMLVSTLLNLFIVPILYVMVRGLLPAKRTEEIPGALPSQAD